MTDAILLEVEGNLATLRINRPERKNAINLAMRPVLSEIVERIRRDSTIRALIITGSGGSFCAGGDIEDMAKLGADGEAARTRMRQTGDFAVALLTLDIPVIAAVDGPAYGGGFGMALTADIILATPEARFCASFARLGLVPDFGLHYSLPRRIGLARAKELIFSTREVTGADALAIGLVDGLHNSDALEDAAKELANGFVATSPTCIGLSKSLLDQSFGLDIRQVIEAETASQALCFTTSHHAAARQRFLSQNRRPSPQT